MRKFVVYKGHDAWVNYKTIVEADNLEDAVEQASAYDYDGEWIATGDVSEFDHREIFAEDTREAENRDYEPPLKELLVTDQEHATILAALRFYQEWGQGDPYNRSDMIHDIATNGDAVISLNDEAIDKLIMRINVWN